MNDFSTIIDAYLDDELTDLQCQELAAWMAQDPDNIDRFVSQCCLDSYLQDIFRREQLASNAAESYRDVEEGRSGRHMHARTAAGSSAPVFNVSAPLVVDAPPFSSSLYSFPSEVGSPIGYLAQGWPLAYLVAAVLLGIGLMVAAVTPVSHNVQIVRQTSAPAVHGSQASEPDIKCVGRITGMVECKWAGSDASRVGCAVAVGRKLAIRSGLLEISYRTGAKVILDGPATYEIDSTNGGYLSLGKLTARVEKKVASKGERGEGRGESTDDQKSQIPNPKSQISLAPRPSSPAPSLSTRHSPLFTIRTPTATVTDLGTEFGVETDGNITRSYVYQGQVEVAPRGGANTAAKIRLHEQQSVAIDRSGAVLPRQVVSGKQFVRRLTLRPFGNSPDLSEGTEVFCQRFDVNSVNLAADYPGLVYGPCLPSTEEADGDTAIVSGGSLRLSHHARGDHTESVTTVQEFSGRMIVAVDIGADGMNISMSHVGLCLGDKIFVFHPGYARDGVHGAFRTKKGGVGRTKDNVDMGFVPHCNLMHHLFVYYDGESTFQVCLIDAANPNSVFRTTVFDRKFPRTFSVGVCRSGSMRTAMFDNLRVIQLPVDEKDNQLKRQ